MKKKSMLICVGVLMSALGAAFVACNNEPNDQKDPEPGENVSFTEYSLEEGVTGDEISFRWENLPEENNTLLVINSDEELKKYVEGDYPEIDFSKKTLLLAFGITPNSGAEPIVKYFKESSAQNYRLYIDVIMGDATSPAAWYTASITDKLSNDSNVELSVKIIN